jgi:DNA-binding NarL/FixJ family response regulator
MEPLLYLENNEDDVVLLQVSMRKVGCPKAVRWVRRSAELKAVLGAAAPADLPKVVLVDLNLDGESGLDTIKWLATHAQFKHIPAFIFSSGRFPEEILAALGHNAVGYMFKPSRLEDWLEIASGLKSMICPSEFVAPSASAPLQPAGIGAARAD